MTKSVKKEASAVQHLSFHVELIEGILVLVQEINRHGNLGRMTGTKSRTGCVSQVGGGKPQRIIIRHYINCNDDFKGYYMQDCEIDARDYANAFTDELFYLIEWEIE